MSVWDVILRNLPEVRAPSQKRLSFKEKLKWTLIILGLFFFLGLIPLFGLGHNALAQFEFLSVVLGAKFGAIISLGIGPIVTASIVLQLLNGSGLVKFDLNSHSGKAKFQAVQKILTLGFIIFESIIYVFMGGLAPDPALAGTALYVQLEFMIVFQMILGGIIIVFLDEVVSKWGFGSGTGLFIVAGVAESIFIRALSPMPSPNQPNIPTGAIPALFASLSQGNPIGAGIMLASVITTIFIFCLAVFLQSMKVEIPLSYGRIRGHGVRWPLNFCYANVIPVILVSALVANMQLWARLIQGWVGHPTWFGGFSGTEAISGFVSWLQPSNLVYKALTGSIVFADIGKGLVYLLVMMGGCVLFSVFWVQTSGMDARSQAQNMMKSGLQIPGFRKDGRVMERLLKRYITPLTVMGGLAIGFLSAAADLMGTLSSGTGLLLAVMIIYQMYEQIAKQHMMDMHPMMRKFME
ncbi:preprotein translocase subunit SecY [Candidatus Woesearchaeota archaeon]|jgi:preprotein translocase subunit SecY|nr:preprotein translocase subunit SecY [Candidatus Woesearchaeota archaeon]MBT3537425.1 preprotein translocase subunit SecY [Candidatus Woesearchaeota archaeon]MBT4697774.1 preprotein translocase subunit SecY [Candidatus Woesearchaeota archaeon]MBT4717539.1 preprotein translocase subunit SecY [Candidatus Woesearchaeota archaeon]MBT7106265.1 preprotein translocase subunit SecY [Candidatus Woesearchaeota archaeon]